MSIWDKSFVYHGAATHANGDAFRRRQRERIRNAAKEREAATKARPKVAELRRAAGAAK